jgi:thiol-disulfide isomerase/thioredoxin
MTRSLNALPFGLAIWLCAITFVANSRVASAQEPPKNFVLLDKPNLVAEINFDDGQGRARKLADFKGKVVLLNIWATWCVPCRKEMPALDRLQASLGGANFEVVPVSIDRGGLEVVRRFYIEVGIRNLALYVDSSGQVLGRVRALGLPTSLLIDRSGEEIGRVIGPAEWDASDIIAFVKCFVSPHDAPPSQSVSKPTATRICGVPAQP